MVKVIIYNETIQKKEKIAKLYTGGIYDAKAYDIHITGSLHALRIAANDSIRGKYCPQRNLWFKCEVRT